MRAYCAERSRGRGLRRCGSTTAPAATGSDTGNLIAVLPGTAPGVLVALSAHLDCVEPCQGVEPLVAGRRRPLGGGHRARRGRQGRARGDHRGGPPARRGGRRRTPTVKVALHRVRGDRAAWRQGARRRPTATGDLCLGARRRRAGRRHRDRGAHPLHLRRDVHAAGPLTPASSREGHLGDRHGGDGRRAAWSSGGWTRARPRTSGTIRAAGRRTSSRRACERDR